MRPVSMIGVALIGVIGKAAFFALSITHEACDTSFIQRAISLCSRADEVEQPARRSAASTLSRKHYAEFGHRVRTGRPPEP